MPRPRDSSDESEGGGRSSEGSRTNYRSSDASGSGSSSTRSNSGSTGSPDDTGSFSSATSTGDSGSTSDSSSRSPRRLPSGYESGKSSASTSASRLSSWRDRLESSSSSSSSDNDVGSNTLRSRMKNLFNKQTEDIVEVEDLGELHARVDAKLLEEVQEYDAVPSEAASYGKNMFWDERYSVDEEVVEWYHSWANLAPTLTQYMDEQDEVLVCGCGNSEMSADMHDDGFENIVNADMSRVVIYQMTETYKAYPMEWKSVDLTCEEFPEEKFDVALDKACLDSIACSSNGASKMASYLQQMDRLLQPEGAFICISFAPPEERLELLEYWDIDQPAKCLAWDVHVDAIGESTPKPELKHHRRSESGSVVYIYVCIKDPNKTLQKRLAKERAKREQEKKLAKMLGFKGGRGRGRGKGR
ncbi:unnamed protein product [Pylaiella littoralis]